MILLKSFYFASSSSEDNFFDLSKEGRMTCFNSYYPFRILSRKSFSCIDCDTPITILYGGNGSGKTTALNIIAEKLHLTRIALYNRTQFLEQYLSLCTYKADNQYPKKGTIITSDDVFNYMLNVRAVNQDVDFNRKKLFEEYNKVISKPRRELLHVNFEDEKNVKTFDKNMAIINNSKSGFVKKTMKNNVREHSNGESALRYFMEKIEKNALYLLDEPENSLSAKNQILLAKYIEDSAWACDCQFIIATHSPFLLAMKRSKIYDLDDDPVSIKKWTELESIKCYRDFFKEHEQDK